ncbi:MAG: efflux RND transporter periplasmic adaptor subunit [Patescibacteria group bacterium]|nr:efflux RND transporter periplasmic adaptor subunit [Patescibacteria group bacterium]MCL5261746.1 efflux RND transporter periplasmic adaptor subunit [Patescibacteria group bacterium]
MAKKYSLKFFELFSKSAKVKALFIVLAAAAVFFAAGRLFYSKESRYDLTVAKKATIVQEVSVTGSVKPASSVNLAFEKSGKVRRVLADIGDRVKSGAILVSLDNAELLADRDQAEAAVKIAEANLSTALSGSRPEELAIETAKLQSSQADLAEARSALVSSFESSYSTIYDVAKNKIDFMFAAQEGVSPTFKLNFSDGETNLRTSVESERNELNSDLIAWRSSLNNVNNASDLDSYINESKDAFRLATQLITNLSNLLNTFSPEVYPSKTTVDSWRAYLSAGQTAINTSLAGFDTATAGYAAAVSAKEVASRNLTLMMAGSTAEEIAAERAKLDQAKANLAKILSQLAKADLRSPIDGIVTKQEAKVGEFVSAGATVAAVISDADFEIEANIPEADIAKVQLNDEAEITLDAYGNDVVFRAIVVSIDPAEIVIDGVPTYKTILKFVDKDDRVKSGMTANIDIITENKPGVLVVPQRAVITRENRKIVRILTNGDPIETLVITGIRGSDGYIEIIEGLKDGDRVIVSEKQ